MTIWHHALPKPIQAADVKEAFSYPGQDDAITHQSSSYGTQNADPTEEVHDYLHGRGDHLQALPSNVPHASPASWKCKHFLRIAVDSSSRVLRLESCQCCAAVGLESRKYVAVQLFFVTAALQASLSIPGREHRRLRLSRPIHSDQSEPRVGESVRRTESGSGVYTRMQPVPKIDKVSERSERERVERDGREVEQEVANRLARGRK